MDLHAAVRASVAYSIFTDITDGGGRTAASASYSQSSSVGTVAGVSGTTSSMTTDKAGYLGQLYDIVGFAVTAPGTAVNENATVQLGGASVLDDATLLPVATTAITWSVVSGPVASISSTGLATASTVYQTMAAMVRGVYGGVSATLGLTVYNVNDDDYGSYAGDGIDDAWQVEYFGLNNPQAGPNVDADGTGQTNLFKYLAGLNPLDPNSRFTLVISSVQGHPGQEALLFAPRYDGHTYTVQSSPELMVPTWTAVTNITISDNGTMRTVTDLAAGTTPRFYRVVVTFP